MPARRMTIDFRAVGDAMRSQGVRRALAQRADRIAAAARSLNAAEQVDARIGREDGTNARGRPYGRITSTAVDAEYGTSKTARRRVLGRAAEQGG